MRNINMSYIAIKAEEKDIVNFESFLEIYNVFQKDDFVQARLILLY
jgi:hypothetical protein